MKRICLFCRREGHQSPDEGVTSNGRIHHRPCHCGTSHAACDECWRKNSKILGAFPDQKQSLPQCPPRAGTRMKENS